MIYPDLKIVPAFLKYDYGIKERGESLEKTFFVPELEKIFGKVTPFWLEENGLPDNIKGLQDKLIEFVEIEKPDIVFFVLMKDEITQETLSKLKTLTTTVNWFCDDQWRFESFTKNIAPLLSYSITVDKHSLSKYKEIGYNNVLLSQWASFVYEKDFSPEKTEYLYDVSFIGGKNNTRAWYIKELEKSGIKVECFGAGWKNGRVSFEKMKEIFQRSKINLNLSNSLPYDIRFYRYLKKLPLGWNIFKPICFLKSVKRKFFSRFLYSQKNAEQIKARNFEIPGCGGFQLSNFVLEIEDYFDIGKEIAVYSSIDELKKQIKYYLENENEREAIKKKGFLRAEKYNYYEKFKEIFKKTTKNKNSC
ncbi:MAG: hypothetical protein A2Y41_06540 [Spirochaetes bacterium GWB1_36_13]|nr:MAG: hypothetical protein A2Y41_06540 [Spirochaetes bacterium GWB1_36_13]